MKQKYFVCDIQKLCKGAGCCKGLESPPELGVSDYLRLSEALRIPIGQFWSQYGDIALASFSEFPPLTFKIELGLFHEPCSFLTQESSCDVYNSRPLACASFPSFLLTEHPEQIESNYKDFSCLHGVCLSPGQLEEKDKLDKLLTRAAELDLKYFWIDGIKFISLGDPYILPKKGAEALELQRQRDKTRESPKTKRLERVVNEFQRVLKRNGTKQLRINADVYRSYWVPVVLSISEEAIKERLESLPKKALDEYRQFNEEVKIFYR